MTTPGHRSGPPRSIGWVEGLVLDFDGTIVDTETVEFEAWTTIWDDHGHALVLEEWLVSVGTSGGFDPLEELARRVDRTLDHDELLARRSALVEEHWGRLEPRPGVVAWLDEAHAAGIPVGVASSAHRGHLETRLAKLGLRDRLTAVVGADDAGAAKPDPAVFLMACDQLGVEPGAALAVEDSSNGVRAAVAAGLRVVAVPNPITSTLDLSAAHVIVESLADHSIASIASALAGPGR